MFLFLALAAAVAWPSSAKADAALTPTLTPRARHIEAELELRDLVSVLPSDVQSKITGIYVAFVPSPIDVSAQAACDDDGDDVIVLSDAMLVLLENVSHAQALDPGDSRPNVNALAIHYAKEQYPGERLLPPAPGAFLSSDSRATEIVHTARFREALSGVLAHELSVFVRDELACPHPTVTRERGDDVWTKEEADLARDIANHLYTPPSRTKGRDRDAVQLTLASKGEAVGYVGWLGFLASIDLLGGHTGWSYSNQRSGARGRLSSVERDLEELRTHASSRTER